MQGHSSWAWQVYAGVQARTPSTNQLADWLLRSLYRIDWPLVPATVGGDFFLCYCILHGLFLCDGNCDSNCGNDISNLGDAVGVKMVFLSRRGDGGEGVPDCTSGEGPKCLCGEGIPQVLHSHWWRGRSQVSSWRGYSLSVFHLAKSNTSLLYEIWRIYPIL